MLFAFERRSYSQVQLASSIFCAIQSWFLQEYSIVGIVSFLSVGNLAVTLTVSLSREHATRMLDSETKSQAFLSHAIKQKFSGVGSAVESLLFRFKKGDVEGEDNRTRLLLDQILQECRKGEDACHAINLSRALTQGKYYPQQRCQSLNRNLKQWMESRTLTVGHLMFLEHDDDPMIELEWELFRLVLCQWSRGAQILVVTFHEEDWIGGSPSLPEIHFQLVNPQVSFSRSFDALRPLANQISGLYVYTHDRLVLRGVTMETNRRPAIPIAEDHEIFSGSKSGDGDKQSISHSEDERTSPSSVPSSSTASLQVEKELAVPPENLRYAILDDNSLVRRNIERIVRTHLKADKMSFSRGETLAECHQFLQQIVDEDVDIAIFDENLEFEHDKHLSGTELAIKARQIGFRGCIISHSARFLDEMTLAEAFDGFVEKTSSWKEFAKGVANAWQIHQQNAMEFTDHHPGREPNRGRRTRGKKTKQHHQQGRTIGSFLSSTSVVTHRAHHRIRHQKKAASTHSPA
jgi:hypothetical protein